MKALEKIYLSQERDKDGCYVDLMWHKHPYEDMENIQYVRTDAFIEKACDAYCAICDTKECDGCAECSWVIKFRRQLLKY